MKTALMAAPAPSVVEPEYTDDFCPFCSAEGMYESEATGDDDTPQWFVHCTSCRAQVGPYARRGDVTKAWAKRSALPLVTWGSK